ncbi:MAG: ribosomal-processing cysteine protease Prp [Clostridia bacterium]|nr:ribosomal-processing cysteine protease Prp [Clostridia bacterium]
MIRVRFKIIDNLIHGYQISGHADVDVMGQDIVCAAVSSAALMTTNTITDIIGARATVVTRSGFLYVRIANNAEACQEVLSGFRLHLQALSEEYPQRIHCN